MKNSPACIAIVLALLLMTPSKTLSAVSIDTPPLLPDGGVGTPYTHNFIASGLAAPLTWKGVGIVPPGLTVSPDGIISGTPTSRGYYDFTVRVTDNQSATVSKAMFMHISSNTLAVPISHPPEYNNCSTCHTTGVPDAAPPVTIFSIIPQPQSTSSSGAFSFDAETGSIFECSLDGSALTPCVSPVNLSGLLIGEHLFRVRATDSAGNIEIPPKSYSWDVHDPLVITTQSLPSGTVATPYSQTLTAYGGFPPPYSWWIESLPAGLSLNTQTGEIGGTPTTAGTYTMTAIVFDPIPNTASKLFSIVIAAPPQVKIRIQESSGFTPYTSIAAAYTAVTAGASIQIVAENFNENLLFNRPVNFYLKGGYVADFSTNSGLTTVTGTLTIARGSVVVEKIVIK